ncbi:hypothetical protein WA1_19075 [Scytonema hofmannii PCC 7110]|uniref:Uncharacterized protein n=1 Tax=Scytonema hofmannii PCC 7110 TaxID=128403 RepID=A0A139XBN0_9CYAN|nr:hypothetical protein [Scytonema hofmannii]KYC42104.1 hypothetical protein WA1_19075 [Scytonema hofmannii PCC 7110]
MNETVSLLSAISIVELAVILALTIALSIERSDNYKRVGQFLIKANTLARAQEISIATGIHLRQVYQILKWMEKDSFVIKIDKHDNVATALYSLYPTLSKTDILDEKFKIPLGNSSDLES